MHFARTCCESRLRRASSRSTALVAAAQRKAIEIVVADKAAAKAFSDADPYTQAGLWRQVELNPVKISFGNI